MQGTILDIFRASLEDGPGIRTTVFLKGCPLSCAWCHNPESMQLKPQLAFMSDKCNHCGACEKACDQGVHIVDMVHKTHHIDYAACNACGACVDSCPTDALKIYGGFMTVEQVMEEVVKDRAFYDATGGGLTISGGEPMVQFEFTKALLIAAKEAGIHTCLDTTGHAPSSRYEALLPYVDLFHWDFKLRRSDAHKEWTGVSNQRILENLALIDQKGGKIHLRCPILNKDHFEGVAELQGKFMNINQIDFLRYHTIGLSKAHAIDAKIEAKSFTEPEKEAVEELVRAHEIQNYTIS